MCRRDVEVAVKNLNKLIYQEKKDIIKKRGVKMGVKENYEINLPDLHKIAEQQIKGKGDFTKSIIENRMRTQKIFDAIPL